MDLQPRILSGRHVRLEPVTAADHDAMRAALDCDAENWAIQLVSAQGAHWPDYWDAMLHAPGRIAFAVRGVASGALAGTSSFLFVDARHRTLEIGSTWFRPEYRGGATNPEAKLLMLDAAFSAGAERVALRIDARNLRSQAAVAKLGAVREGVIRRHFITWTGHARDTAVFSIIAEEWPAVRARLEARLASFDELRMSGA